MKLIKAGGGRAMNLRSFLSSTSTRNIFGLVYLVNVIAGYLCLFFHRTEKLGLTHRVLCNLIIQTFGLFSYPPT